MNCWNQLICIKSNGTKFSGASCCGSTSPKFKSMESDMHNLIPSFDWTLESTNDFSKPTSSFD